MRLTEHERTELIAKARIFSLAAPVILPLIEKMKKDALGRLMQAHKAGRTNTSTLVAELSVLADLEGEIIRKDNEYKTLQERYNERNAK